jgi:hypothetical protein
MRATTAELNMKDDGMIEARYTQQLCAAGAFTAALAAVPSEDWSRNWVADRTIMLRMTSKNVSSRSFSFYQLRLPTVVKLTGAGKLQHILTQLEKITSRYSITTLDLRCGRMSGQDLDGNKIRAVGADRKCCRSAQRCLSCILEAMTLAMPE